MVWVYLIRLNLVYVRADYTQMQTETQTAFESTSVHETAKECVVFGSLGHRSSPISELEPKH